MNGVLTGGLAEDGAPGALRALDDRLEQMLAEIQRNQARLQMVVKDVFGDEAGPSVASNREQMPGLVGALHEKVSAINDVIETLQAQIGRLETL